MLVFDDERRREQDVIASPPVDRASHRVGHEAAGHTFTLDAEVELQRGIERFLGCPVADDLDAEKKAAAADVADMRMVAETRGEPRGERCTEHAYFGEEAVALDDFLHGERRRASDRMPEIGVPVLKESSARRHR